MTSLLIDIMLSIHYRISLKEDLSPQTEEIDLYLNNSIHEILGYSVKKKKKSSAKMRY